MPAKGKVSIPWQIVFSFIPGVLIWSFYRVKKLRIFLVMIAAPVTATIYIVPLVIIGPEYFEYCDPVLLLIWDFEGTCINEEIFIPSLVLELIYHVFKTYFIVKWSREWNKQFS